MSSTPIFSWQIYCQTEGQFVGGFSATSPICCFNNNTHVVNLNSVQNLGLIGPNTVVAQDSSPTTGYFQTMSIPITIPPPTSVPNIITIDNTYPFDLIVWEMSMAQNPANIGDTISVVVGPDTEIAENTQSVSAGATSVYASPTAFTYYVRGSLLSITDGTNKESGGMITALNSSTGEITFTNPLVNSYAAGSALLFCVYPLYNVVFDSTERIVIGNKGLKSRVVPAGTVFRIIYTDNTMNTETINCYLLVQYYYS